MKLNATYLTGINKGMILAGAFVLYMLPASASLLPVQPAPHHFSLQSISADTNVPGVVYASIDASANEKSVFVKWVTASEQANSHFEVERSLDMKNFKTVALILGGFIAEGTGKSYQFKENAGEVRNGKTVYYRLKQFDTDGHVNYSTILAVKLDSKEVSNKMQVFPNPLGKSLSVHLNNDITGNTEIRIVDLAGKTWLSKQSNNTKGNTIMQVEGLEKLTPGMYIAQLIVNGAIVENQKLVKE